MTEAREHGWYEELVPSYALGALDRAERQAFERHLAACPRCRAQAEEYAGLSDHLLYAIPPVEARADLTEDLRRRVRGKTRASASTGWLSFLRHPGWAAAALAVALLVLTNAYWADRTGRAERDLTTLAALTQNPGSLLRASAEGERGRGIVYVDPGAKIALLCVYNLPELDPGKTYQAWLVRGDQRVSGGTFQVDKYGYGVLLVQSAIPFSEFEGLGITVEPAGGSPGPTSPRVIGGNL